VSDQLDSENVRDLKSHAIKIELRDFAQSLGLTEAQLRERFLHEPALIYQALALSIDGFEGPPDQKFPTLLTSLALHFYTQGMEDALYVAEEYDRKVIIPKHLNLMEALGLTALMSEAQKENKD
jgi:hypothetical protein